MVGYEVLMVGTEGVSDGEMRGVTTVKGVRFETALGLQRTMKGGRYRCLSLLLLVLELVHRPSVGLWSLRKLNRN